MNMISYPRPGRADAAALAMIGLILIQHGKGADMGAAFGSGSSGSLFGASGSANFLSRTTAVLAAVFFVCTLALAYFGNCAPVPSGGSVLDAALAAPAAGAAPLRRRRADPGARAQGSAGRSCTGARGTAPRRRPARRQISARSSRHVQRCRRRAAALHSG